MAGTDDLLDAGGRFSCRLPPRFSAPRLGAADGTATAAQAYLFRKIMVVPCDQIPGAGPEDLPRIIRLHIVKDEVIAM
jgi:hypothetical protein